MRTSPDYQHHVEAKRTAIPIPDLHNKSVLDIGCDHGFWSFNAVSRGASKVLGIDRNREVRGIGFCDLVAENNKQADQAEFTHCNFARYDLGKQWPELGRFDVVYLFSLYHHLYENCGDHRAIWYWLWRHTAQELLWENPVDCSDKVVQCNVSPELQAGYTQQDIMDAAKEYFEVQYIGPAMHEQTRWVYRFRPKPEGMLTVQNWGTVRAGAGGASKAFAYADGRRIHEIERVLGFTPYPGSLNLHLDEKFDFSRHYVRAQILDVSARGIGLDVAWFPRWCRFYPLTVNGQPGAAMRFEGESYPDRLAEIIAPIRLRDKVETGGKVMLCRP